MALLRYWLRFCTRNVRPFFLLKERSLFEVGYYVHMTPVTQQQQHSLIFNLHFSADVETGSPNQWSYILKVTDDRAPFLLSFFKFIVSLLTGAKIIYLMLVDFSLLLFWPLFGGWFEDPFSRLFEPRLDLNQGEVGLLGELHGLRL